MNDFSTEKMKYYGLLYDQRANPLNLNEDKYNCVLQLLDTDKSQHLSLVDLGTFKVSLLRSILIVQVVKIL